MANLCGLFTAFPTIAPSWKRKTGFMQTLSIIIMDCFCFKSNKFVGAALRNVTSSYEFSCDINTVNVRILGNLESSNKIRWRLLLLAKHPKARAVSSDGYKELPRLCLPITFMWVITCMWSNKMSFYDLFFHLSKIEALQLKLILFWEMIFYLKINLKSYMKFHSEMLEKINLQTFSA